MQAEMTKTEAAAWEAIFHEWVEWSEGRREDPPQLDEAQRIASSFGLVNSEDLALEASKKALSVYLGKAWGVGPDANWRDKISVSFLIFVDTLKRKFGFA